MPHEHSAQVHLPHYENPPLVETILGVQFDRLACFRNAHLGAFWKVLGADDWPTVDDAPPLYPEFERFTEESRWASGPQVHLTPDPTRRLQMKSEQGDRMIQVQNNRLHLNWLGEARDTYPRYERVREEFMRVLERFIEFAHEANAGEVRPNQWEITYLNHIPKGTVWNSPADWCFFRPLAAVPTIEGLIEGESFGGEWHFVIPGQRGRLHVQWQHALWSPGENKREKHEIIRLTLTARGPVQEGNDHVSAVLDGLDLGRRTIVRSFEQLMSEPTNRHWRLNRGCD